MAERTSYILRIKEKRKERERKEKLIMTHDAIVL